ncbi:MAG: DUF1295 domain-containing protein [Promethearchaeota archaeon]
MNSQLSFKLHDSKSRKVSAWARTLSKSMALSLILGIYLLTLVFSWLEITILLKTSLNPIIILLITDITATLIIYLFSTLLDNASVYDPYWSVIPIPIMVFYWTFNPQWSNFTLQQVLTFILVLLWGFRLTSNWVSYWSGFDFEDWRYRDFRAKNPKLFWLINLVGIQLVPTVIVFAGSLSLWPIFANPLDKSAGFTPTSSLLLITAIIGAIIMLGAISFEFFADRQMHRFLANPNNKGKTISDGLWRYSRHPNYFGEVSFWWGMYIFGLSSNFHYWWTIIGPIMMTLLFLFISIPMMEKHNLARRDDYWEYQRKTSKIVPWFPRK